MHHHLVFGLLALSFWVLLWLSGLGLHALIAINAVALVSWCVVCAVVGRWFERIDLARSRRKQKPLTLDDFS